MDSIVYTEIPPCDAAAVAEAARYGVSDLHEALGAVAGRAALMAPVFTPANPGQRIAGQAVTAFNFPGDNLLMHKALELARPGQILVLGNGAGAPGALWGELASVCAKVKGLAGVIIEGAVRDIDAIREMRFPVWFTMISAGHSEKRGPGSVNLPMVCGGALVEPGDVVVADGDGVLVIPRARLVDTVAGARQRGAKEAAMRARLEAGELLYNVANMGAAFDAAGIAVRQGTWLDR